MVLVNSCFHTRKNFNNYPKFWHAYSKMFASPAVDRKCLGKKIGLKGRHPGRPRVSGRPCYQHAAPYGVFLYTVNWCTSSCLMCIPVLLCSHFRFCLLRCSFRWSKKKSHFMTNLMLYSFFWPLNCMCRRFGTLCSIFVGVVSTPKHPKERMQHSEHGESLKSRNLMLCTFCATAQYIHSLTSNLLHSMWK